VVQGGAAGFKTAEDHVEEAAFYRGKEAIPPHSNSLRVGNLIINQRKGCGA
jgi:hypothetical protein